MSRALIGAGTALLHPFYFADNTLDIYIQREYNTDLDEAAFIDGASVLRTFFVIIYPMMKPIISAVLIMDALWI